MREVVVKEIPFVITVPQMYLGDIPRRYAPPPSKGDLPGAYIRRESLCSQAVSKVLLRTGRNVEEASSLFTPVASPDAARCRVYEDGHVAPHLSVLSVVKIRSSSAAAERAEKVREHE
jgi:hypothetical protein